MGLRVEPILFLFDGDLVPVVEDFFAVGEHHSAVDDAGIRTCVEEDLQFVTAIQVVEVLDRKERASTTQFSPKTRCSLIEYECSSSSYFCPWR